MPTIRKRGAKWQAQVRLKKHGIIVFSDSASFDTERQARLWANSLEAKVLREGVEVHLTGSATVTALIHAWCTYREGIKPLSRGYQHSVRALLLSPFAEKRLDQLAAQDIVSWGTAQGKTIAPATLMHHLMVLRSAYMAAPSLVGFTPPIAPVSTAMDMLRRVRLVAPSTQRERRVSDAELNKIITHLKSKFLLIPTDIFVRLAVALPRRREELCEMRWSNYKDGILKLVDTKNPTRYREELVPVPPAARAIIDSLPRVDGEERMFPFKPESVSAAFQRAVRATGLEDLRLHDLRHEGISRLFEQGLQIQEVALISGHVSWAALRRYTQLSPMYVLEKLNAGSQRAQKAPAKPE